MPTVSETSDSLLLDLLRQSGGMSVSELIRATEVTATAVRQRLSRLMTQGLVERVATETKRGRPSHRYTLTEKARRQSGSNFADLAMVLWQEIRSISDPEIRRGLLARIAQSLAERYAAEINGSTPDERMQAVAGLLAERRVAVAVEHAAGEPVLTILDCPYPELAERDRGVCAMEKMLFTKLVQQDLRLSQCRLDGHSCCQFESRPSAEACLASSV